MEFHGIEWDFMAIEWASMGFNAIKNQPIYERIQIMWGYPLVIKRA